MITNQNKDKEHFLCLLCNTTFESFETLKWHKETADGIYQCLVITNKQQSTLRSDDLSNSYDGINRDTEIIPDKREVKVTNEEICHVYEQNLVADHQANTSKTHQKTAKRRKKNTSLFNSFSVVDFNVQSKGNQSGRSRSSNVLDSSSVDRHREERNIIFGIHKITKRYSLQTTKRKDQESTNSNVKSSDSTKLNSSTEKVKDTSIGVIEEGRISKKQIEDHRNRADRYFNRSVKQMYIAKRGGMPMKQYNEMMMKLRVNLMKEKERTRVLEKQISKQVMGYRTSLEKLQLQQHESLHDIGTRESTTINHSSLVDDIEVGGVSFDIDSQNETNDTVACTVLTTVTAGNTMAEVDEVQATTGIDEANNIYTGETTQDDNTDNDSSLMRGNTIVLNQQHSSSSEGNTEDTTASNLLLDKLTVQEREGYLQRKVVFTPAETNGIALTKLLNEAGTPKNMFDKIINWTEAYHSSKSTIGYKNLVQDIVKRLRYEEFFPFLSEVSLPIDDTKTNVVMFDFGAQVFSLLTDQELMQPENLLFGDRPGSDRLFERSGFEDSSRGDINTSQWYIDTCKEKIKDRDKDVVIPILAFQDETHHDSKGNCTSDPFMITLGCFKRNIRNLPEAWRHIGFVPKSSGRRPKGWKMTDIAMLKVMDFHKCLSVILEPMKKFQSNGPYKFRFKFCGDKLYNLYFPLMFVIGDMKGHNILCGRKAPSLKTKSAMRDCDCPTKEINNRLYECTRIKYSDIKTMCNNLNDDDKDVRTNAMQKLKDISHYGGYGFTNAFDGVDMGSNVYGINGCTPSELLHLFKMKFPNEIFSSYFLLFGSDKKDTASKIRMKTVLSSLVSKTYRQSDRNFPDIRTFKTSIEKEKSYTADEKFARIFALYLYCLTTVSTTIIADTRNKNDHVERSLVSVTHNKFLKLMESCMILYDWMYQDEFPQKLCKPANKSRFHVLGNDFIIQFRELFELLTRNKDYTDILPEEEDDDNEEEPMGPKVHALLHLLVHIYDFGSAKNFDSGPLESGHKRNIKLPGKKSSMRKATVNLSVATNYFEISMFRKAARLSGVEKENTKRVMDISNDTNARNVKTCVNSRSSHFVMKCDFITREISLTWKKENVIPKKSFDPEALVEIFKVLFEGHEAILCMDEDYDFCEINGFTTLDHGDYIFRAHPAYSVGSLPWFDHAYFEWQGIDEAIPGKLQMFLDLNGLKGCMRTQHASDIGIERYCVIIRSADCDVSGLPKRSAMLKKKERETGYDGKLLLSRFWTVCETINALPVESIDKPAFVYMDIIDDGNLEKSNYMIEIKPRDEWKDVLNQQGSNLMGT